MEVTKIENHVELALERRLEQYVDKENLKSFIEIQADGWQDLENVFIDLKTKRLDIDEAEGVQLDQIGKMIKQPRLGWDDTFYRIILKFRINQLSSGGNAEKIIKALKSVTQANAVHYMNLKNAEIALGTDGTFDPALMQFLLKNMQRVVIGGVRLDYICFYETAGDGFSCDGPNLQNIGGGFGTIADLGVGGLFGQLYTIKNKFKFGGNSTEANGFGTIADPLVGGVL